MHDLTVYASKLTQRSLSQVVSVVSLCHTDVPIDIFLDTAEVIVVHL